MEGNSATRPRHRGWSYKESRNRFVTEGARARWSIFTAPLRRRAAERRGGDRRAADRRTGSRRADDQLNRAGTIGLQASNQFAGMADEPIHDWVGPEATFEVPTTDELIPDWRYE